MATKYKFDENFEGSVGSIKPIGIGDLLLVEDELLRYEMSEISYIENIMKTEKKERVHRALNRTETYYSTEKYSESEETQDLEQATRYEMQNEVQTTLDKSSEFSAGVDVSATYGPVKVDASADYAIENAESISESASSSFGQEITEKSTSRILETFKETSSQTTTTEVEETNTHGFDNTLGTEHAIGIYRYLDKYYKANLYNYGKRLFFEFIIPEPASFYIHSLGSNDLSDVTVDEPLPIDDLKISEIQEDSYLSLVKKYKATGVNTPPAEFILIGKAISNREATDPNSLTEYRITAMNDPTVSIPDGYMAKEVFLRFNRVRYSGAFQTLDTESSTELTVQIGQHEFDDNTSLFHIQGMDNETGFIPINIQSTNHASFIVSIEIMCERTTEAFNSWQLSVYYAILDAYNSQKASYDSQLYSAKSRATAEIVSVKTDDIDLIQKYELEKLSLQLLTAQHFAHYNATKSNTESGFPEFKIKEAMNEGSYIQFFEQAFEWDQMTFEYYPYFWSRKNTWAERILLEHTDKNFQAFLQAGAARVLVPVRKHYVRAIHYYLVTGKPWEGGDAPIIDDPLWVPIIEDLSDEATMDEKEFISSWEYKLPTDLVILQEDSELPKW